MKKKDLQAAMDELIRIILDEEISLYTSERAYNAYSILHKEWMRRLRDEERRFEKELKEFYLTNNKSE